jgi:hypothetical protein
MGFARSLLSKTIFDEKARFEAVFAERFVVEGMGGIYGSSEFV